MTQQPLPQVRALPDTTYVEVRTADLYDAMGAAFGMTQYSRPLPEERTEVSLGFVRALRDELSAQDPSCDHSVNLCSCSAVNAITELSNWLLGVEWCPECQGDGFIVGSDGEPTGSCPKTVPLVTS